jgi:hemerythrin-like domain-containing protein
MKAHDYPNIAYSLIAIHATITRGLQVALERSLAYADSGFPDETTRQGFCDFVHCLVEVLTAHHEGEDTLAFPFMRARLSEAPYEELMAQHREMIPYLGAAAADNEKIHLDQETGEALKRLYEALDQIYSIWDPHIRIEESHFNPSALEEAISVEEHVQLNLQIGEYSQQHTSPDYLVLPFTLYNLPVDLRDEMTRSMPPIVTQNLIPHVWKEKWAPMKLFLLD